MHRRRFLTLTGSTTAAILAGCGSIGDDDEGERGDDSTATETSTETTAESTPEDATTDDEGGADGATDEAETDDASAPAGTALSEADGLSIVEHRIYEEGGQNEGLSTIEGIVVNERDSTADYVEVVGTTYDEDGNDTEYYDDTTALEAGAEWQFAVELHSHYQNVEEYEVVVYDESAYPTN